jgi:hypothetical protein
MRYVAILAIWATWIDSAFAAPDDVISTGANLFARKTRGGNIFEYSSSGWMQIGGPAAQLSQVGGTLYAISPGTADVWRYSGSRATWNELTNSHFDAILPCWQYLCGVTDSDFFPLSIYSAGIRYFQGDADGVVCSISSHIYLANPSSVFSMSGPSFGTPPGWTTIGSAANAVYCTSDSVFAVSPSDRSLWQYSGSGTGWNHVSTSPAITYAAVDSVLYRLMSSSVDRYVGNGRWSTVGGAASWIYGGPSGLLYASSPSSGDIWGYDGSGWTNYGHP